MKNKIATIILNRNTPKLGNSIYEHLLEYERNISDIFLIEAGTEKNLMSDYFTWHNNELAKLGLRLHETDTPPRALAVGTPFDNTNMLYTAEPIRPVHAVSDDELIGAAEADKVKLNINHASLDLVKKAARTN